MVIFGKKKVLFLIQLLKILRNLRNNLIQFLNIFKLFLGCQCAEMVMGL